MSGLVNYSSGEDQDDYHYKKAGERERVQRSGRSAVGLGVDRDGKRQLKKHYRERSKSSSSCDSSSDHSAGGKVITPRKEKFVDSKTKRSRSTHTSNNNTSIGGYNDEDKYKSEKGSEKFSRDLPRDKRESRDAKYSKDSRRSRDYKDESKNHDNSHSHESRKYDDNKRYGKDYKRDNNKRESNTDFHRDDKRARNDDKKIYTTSSYKDRSNSSKSRYDERKSYDDRYNNERREEKQRINDDRRNSGNNTYGRKEGLDYDDRKDRRTNNEDRRAGQRSYTSQDRSNSYRSNSNKYPERRTDEDRKHHHSSDTADKTCEPQSNTHREYPSDTRSNDIKLSSPPDEVPEKKILPSARNFEALLTLPLSETVSKQLNKVTIPAATAASDDTAAPVQLPNYYNPKVINASKYATQMQKRKLIWGSKKTEDVAAKWGHAQFSQDSDGKVASKFMRLMGIKNSGTDSNADESGGDKTETSSSTTVAPNKPDFKSREAMFSTMEQQYEVARQVTHTMRGVGLGFNSQSRPY